MRSVQQHRNCWHFVLEHLNTLAQPSCLTTAQLSSLWRHVQIHDSSIRQSLVWATLRPQCTFTLSMLYNLIRYLQNFMQSAVQYTMYFGIVTPGLSVLPSYGLPTHLDINGVSGCPSLMALFFQEIFGHYH